MVHRIVILIHMWRQFLCQQQLKRQQIILSKIVKPVVLACKKPIRYIFFVDITRGMQRLLVIRMRHQKLPVTHCSCFKALQATIYMFADVMKAIGLYMKLKALNLNNYYLSFKFLMTNSIDIC